MAVMAEHKIYLVCWDAEHRTRISADSLRQATAAPVCTAAVTAGPPENRTIELCGNAIWAVEHDGEPTRYVGRPPVPDGNWRRWADCI